MNNKVRNIKVVIQELVEDRPCLPNSTELRSEMRRGKGDKSLGMERCQEKEINGTTAIRGGADADLVLSVLLTNLNPAVTKSGQRAKVHLMYSSLTHAPVCGPMRVGLKNSSFENKRPRI